jgi:hypothetical protein
MNSTSFKPTTTQIPQQEIHFCTAPDGVRIAYALAGSGPPLVKTANWLNHLEYDWESPIWSQSEGIVSKKLNAPYRSGPSRTWVKVKAIRDFPAEWTRQYQRLGLAP